MDWDDLKDYCNCVEADDDDVSELVNVISLATGWQSKPCETFLKSTRREVIDLPSCTDCPIVFDPYYVPFDQSSFKFYLVTIEDIAESVSEITNFAYHTSDGKFYVNPGIPSCKCSDKCGCPATYKMIVEYDAGYETIPDCLLPAFCNVLDVIHRKNTCDCNTCSCDNTGSEENVTYATGDIVTVALETDIGKMLVEQYKKQLGMISLYRRQRDLWGFVV